MNNSLIIGETQEKENGTLILNPYAVIPMQEGIRLLPLDIEITGVKMPEIYLSNDKIMYSVEPSTIIVDQYKKLLAESQESQETQEEK